MKCSHPGCRIDPTKRERRTVLLRNGSEGAKAILVVVGPHAAAYELECEALRDLTPELRREVRTREHRR